MSAAYNFFVVLKVTIGLFPCLFDLSPQDFYDVLPLNNIFVSSFAVPTKFSLLQVNLLTQQETKNLHKKVSCWVRKTRHGDFYLQTMFVLPPRIGSFLS